MVKKIIRQGVFFGIGTVFLTKDAITKNVKALLREAKKQQVNFNKAETQQFLAKVVAESRKQRVKLEAESKKEAKRMMKKIGYLSVREAKELKRKVAKLEKNLRAAGRRKVHRAATSVLRKTAPKRK